MLSDTLKTSQSGCSKLVHRRLRLLTSDSILSAGKVNCGRGTQTWMGESHRSLGRPDEFPAASPAGCGHLLCDPGWFKGRTQRQPALLMGLFLESGPEARVVAAGLEGCRDSFHCRSDPGLD